jgi:hypothetical protein
MKIRFWTTKRKTEGKRGWACFVNYLVYTLVNGSIGFDNERQYYILLWYTIRTYTMYTS